MFEMSVEGELRIQFKEVSNKSETSRKHVVTSLFVTSKATDGLLGAWKMYAV